jgi:sugar phosphate isomerase/epimerase
MNIGFTIDESALNQFGFHWLDTLITQDLFSCVELSPEKRAANSDVYLQIKKRLEKHQLSYQLHVPYFVHPTDYSINSLTESKQKIVNTFENWLLLTESMRYDDQMVPIIIHPGYIDQHTKKPEDVTAHYIELTLNLLHRKGLSRHYTLALENLPTRKYEGFGTSLDGIMAFRKRFFHQKQLAICLDLCHYEVSKDSSSIPYAEIDLYHIHQYNPLNNMDHLSLQENQLDFTKHFEALKKTTTGSLNLELLLYAESAYIERLNKDLQLLHQRLKD